MFVTFYEAETCLIPKFEYIVLHVLSFQNTIKFYRLNYPIIFDKNVLASSINFI